MGIKVSGLTEINRNLAKELKKIEGKSVSGFEAAMVYLKSEMIPVTPAEFGTLRNSVFSVVRKTLNGTIRASLGFTAKYAPFVHEMPDTTDWSTPGTGNKFLENTVKNNQREIVEIVAKRAQIK